jgi:RsiW-degrading membrane proteinase PrsW (M82 family)
MSDPISTDLAKAPESVSRAAYASPGPATAGVATRSRSLFVPALIGFLVLGVVLLVVIGFLFIALGPGIVAVGGIMALVPLAIVLLGIRWIDRWEPEPRGVLLFAFLWGAGASVLVALIVGLAAEAVLTSGGATDGALEFIGAVIQAPIVEETAKGFGVLLIFLVARKHFDGPVDGIVYAATVAAGFAFTENILYFGAELGGGEGSSVAGVFIIRGLMSPFAHVMFTLCTGVAIGIAARRRGALRGVLAFVIGLVPAMLLHALWNGATFVVGDDFFIYYVVVQVPLFIGAIILVVALRRHEARLTKIRLDEYAAAGWFNPDETTALATGRGRSQAIAWARQHGLGAVMRGYIRDATRLAFIRQRLVIGHDVVGAQVDEAAVLASIVARRAALQPQVQSVSPAQQA